MKKIIISRDGNLEYRYGFFYIDPAVAPTTEKTAGKCRGRQEPTGKKG